MYLRRRHHDYRRPIHIVRGVAMVHTPTDAVLGTFNLMFTEAFTHILCRLRIGAGAAQYSQVAEARPDGSGHGAPVNVFQLGCALQSRHDTQTILSRSEEHTSELQSLMRISYA